MGLPTALSGGAPPESFAATLSKRSVSMKPSRALAKAASEGQSQRPLSAAARKRSLQSGISGSQYIRLFSFGEMGDCATAAQNSSVRGMFGALSRHSLA